MENKLKQLFDYQKFAQNPHLNEVFNDVLTETSVELSDDQLYAAAGGVKQEKDDKNPYK